MTQRTIGVAGAHLVDSILTNSYGGRIQSGPTNATDPRGLTSLRVLEAKLRTNRECEGVLAPT